MPSKIDFVTGWYGKLPARGDFICRRLPGALVQRWDAWLQSAIGSSSARLGARWLECYSTAPLWRFLLAPGLVSASAIAGVLMPSADRVGRLFPLTIASVLAPGAVDLAKTLGQAHDWFTSIEAAARAALDPALDLDAYDERIRAIAFPAASVVPLNSDSASARTQPAESIGMRAIHTRLEPEQELSAEASIVRLQERMDAEAEPCSLWLTRSSSSFGAWALASAGLPPDEQFCAMLDGDWTGHGWT